MKETQFLLKFYNKF